MPSKPRISCQGETLVINLPIKLLALIHCQLSTSLCFKQIGEGEKKEEEAEWTTQEGEKMTSKTSDKVSKAMSCLPTSGSKEKTRFKFGF